MTTVAPACPPSGLSRRALLAAAAALPLAAVATPGTPAPADGLIFDAAFARRGIGAYRVPNPRGLRRDVDYGLTADPHDRRRRVMWFDSHRGLNVGTAYPRSSVSTASIIKPAYHGHQRDVYWSSFSFLLPAASRLRRLGDWCSIGTGAFGPPWGGPSPLALALVRDRAGRHHLELAGRPGLIGAQIAVPVDEWVTVVTGFRLAYRGWIELAARQGSGPLTPVRVAGRRRAPYSALRAGNNDGWVRNAALEACYANVGVYGPQRMRLLFAHHRIAHTRAAVGG